MVETKHKRLTKYLQDTLVLLILGGLLYSGASWQMFSVGSDATYYQCYAVAFWQGWSGLKKLPPEQCTFLVHPDKDVMLISQDGLVHAMQHWRLPPSLIQIIASQEPEKPYHTLPHEYPWVTLLSFSLALIAPAYWYQVAFAIEMFLFIGCIYFVLQRWRSRPAAVTFALCLLVGNASTALARIDIIPAGLTLFAVICAAQKHWNWAFVLLALATLSKVYPVALLIPFILALQRDTQEKWYAWCKWRPVALFVGICILVTAISLVLSVVGTLAPLGYFAHRPVQIESLLASLLWLCSLLGKTSLTYVFTFDALNVLSSWSAGVTFLLIGLLVVGLLSTWWLQWRGHMDLAMACLLTLLIVIITAKVFSPQYLIWVIPLVAYVGQGNRWWLIFWALVGYLTSLIYPYMYPVAYSHVLLAAYLPRFYLLAVARNFLLLGFIIGVLISRSCLYHQLSQHKEQAEYGKQSEENPQQDLVEVE
jgi:hypothetical protein